MSYTLYSYSATADQLGKDGVFTQQAITFDYMNQSVVNATTGSTVVQLEGINVLQRFYYIYDINIQSDVVQSQSGESVLPEDAGPTYFGVTSQEGIDFLNGTFDISGFEILRYCDGCTDSNGLVLSAATAYMIRFYNLGNLVSDYLRMGATTGYFLYGYPSEGGPTVIFNSTSYIDREGGVKYSFTNSNGEVVSIIDVATILQATPGQIITSLESATPIIPTPTTNYQIQSCCDTNLFEVVEGPYNIGDNVCTENYPGHSCWEVVGTTTDPVTLTITPCKGMSFTDCTSCVSTMYGGRGCPQFYSVTNCCEYQSEVVYGSFMIGKYYPDSNYAYWNIGSPTSGPATITLNSSNQYDGCAGGACYGIYNITRCCDEQTGVAENFLAIGKTYVDVNGDCWTVESTSTSTPNIQLLITNGGYDYPSLCTDANNHCYYLIQLCSDSAVYAKTWGEFIINNVYYANESLQDCWMVISPLTHHESYDLVRLNGFSYGPYSCPTCLVNHYTIYTQVISCVNGRSEYTYIINPSQRNYQSFVDQNGECWTVQNQLGSTKTMTLIPQIWFNDCSTCG